MLQVGDSSSAPRSFSSLTLSGVETPRRGSDRSRGLHPSTQHHPVPTGQVYMPSYPCWLPMNQVPTCGLMNLLAGLSAWQALLRAHCWGDLGVGQMLYGFPGENTRVSTSLDFPCIRLWKAVDKSELQGPRHPRILNRAATSESSIFIRKII